MLDYIKISCAVPALRLADPMKNARDICAYMDRADKSSTDLLIFPELALTGSTCGDLFFQESLWEKVKLGLEEICVCSSRCPGLNIVLGAPIRLGDKLFNCAFLLKAGQIVGIVPKSELSNEERRWFTSGDDLAAVSLPEAFGAPAFGSGLLFDLGDGAILGVQIGDIRPSPVPESALYAANGANIIANIASGPALAGHRVDRAIGACSRSRDYHCIYAYCSSGVNESAADMVYSGYSIIAENGKTLIEYPGLCGSNYMISRDCDLGRVNHDRRVNPSFKRCASVFAQGDIQTISAEERTPLRADGSSYPVNPEPFIPPIEELARNRCMEIFNIQVEGLKRRLALLGSNAVIGVSGGLDSTLALLVAVEAMRRLGKDAAHVHGITMPCFGTSDRTYDNSWKLMNALGVSAKEISIRDAVSLHFWDIGHDPAVHNSTFENAQARERTQILMDFASTVNGIVIGTGDLSELALGWCTYNGDHMSMYSVNASVPKTLIRKMIEFLMEEEQFAPAQDVLGDILDTPISPELLPPDAAGKIAQQTEDIVGPYILHDFFLYHCLRYGFGPKKIFHLACRAFEDEFDAATIKKWLCSFYRRFFTQQFKRNCMPDGVTVGSIALGPRGSWQMPSDAAVFIWLEEAESL